MRSLRDISARRDTVVELADWVEISTFFRDDQSVSEEDLVRALVREGGTRTEQLAREKAADAFTELSGRDEAIGTAGDKAVAKYPFKLDGTVLKRVADPLGANDDGLLYAFLLAVTRASMDSTSRQLNSIDPTLLFEDVCAESLCEFWGGRSPVSNVLVAGTSNNSLPRHPNGRYASVIDTLTKSLNEGVGWKATAVSPGAGDGGLDIAVWRRFNDKRPGGLVGFAQCKTGDGWRAHLGKNNPASICHRFFAAPLVLPPLPIYMVPCRVSHDEWDDILITHRGLLLDRCRITTFGTGLTAKIVAQCKNWLGAAIDRERRQIALQQSVAIQAAAARASGAMP